MKNVTAPAISCEDVTVRFGRHEALGRVTLSLRGRGVIGLIGVNGAGKTTLINVIRGVLRPTSGRVRVTEEGARAAVCLDVPSFEPEFTADEVLLQAALLFEGRRRVPSRQERCAVLERVGLSEAADRRSGGFSRGMRQRLGIAAAIVCSPPILFLDEPTSALDPVGRQQVLDIIADLGREMLVVFSSHVLNDVETVAERLIVIDAGTILFTGTVHDFLSDFGGESAEFVVTGDDVSALASMLAPGSCRLEDGGTLAVAREAVPDVLSYFASRPNGFETISRKDRSLARSFFSLLEDSRAAS